MSRTSRKLEHLKLAMETAKDEVSSFHDAQFVHQALPEAALEEVSISSTIGGLLLSSPIIINAMTGGSDETKIINENLALLVRETGLSIAVGSQMSALKHKEYLNSYQIIRKTNPKAVVFANLGAEATVEQAKEAVEMVEANALQIHLNVIQELIMPEGDRNFKGTLERIRAIREGISVPLIIKEVGFGISKETAKKLHDNGISMIDVGGKGGTNFAVIENKRRNKPLLFFNEWGIDTIASILEVKTVEGIEVIATGGVRDGLDIAKAIGLGASAVGMAGMILRVLTKKQLKGAIEYIENLHQELKMIMTGLGAVKPLDLQKRPMVISGKLKDWCELRDLPVKSLANRF